jgi:hypothetical protein
MAPVVADGRKICRKPLLLLGEKKAEVGAKGLPVDPASREMVVRVRPLGGRKARAAAKGLPVIRPGERVVARIGRKARRAGGTGGAAKGPNSLARCGPSCAAWCAT